MDNSSKNDLSSEVKDKGFEDISQERDARLNSSLEEPPELELKPSPEHLQYAFLEEGFKLPVIIVSNLSVKQKERLLNVLRRHKRFVAWKIFNIRRINLLSVPTKFLWTITINQ